MLISLSVIIRVVLRAINIFGAFFFFFRSISLKPETLFLIEITSFACFHF